MSLCFQGPIVSYSSFLRQTQQSQETGLLLNLKVLLCSCQFQRVTFQIKGSIFHQQSFRRLESDRSISVFNQAKDLFDSIYTFTFQLYVCNIYICISFKSQKQPHSCSVSARITDTCMYVCMYEYIYFPLFFRLPLFLYRVW